MHIHTVGLTSWSVSLQGKHLVKKEITTTSIRFHLEKAHWQEITVILPCYDVEMFLF